MTVLKSGGRKQPFDRDKLIKSMQIALRKRPVELENIERAANAIVRQLETMGEADITSGQIGEFVMKSLARLDAVGYIRYASVYKDFRKPEDFNEFLDDLKDLHKSSDESGSNKDRDSQEAAE
jgi:transcriptional repressor NrdR